MQGEEEGKKRDPESGFEAALGCHFLAMGLQTCHIIYCILKHPEVSHRKGYMY